jgi:hypothetical protein
MTYYFNQWDGIAYAYHLTGDPDLLAQAAFALGDMFGGVTDVSAFIGNRVWWMFKAGYVMDALVAAGNGNPASVPAMPPAESTGEIQVLSDGRPFEIEVRMERIASTPLVQGEFGDVSDVSAATVSLMLFDPSVAVNNPAAGGYMVDDSVRRRL